MHPKIALAALVALPCATCAQIVGIGFEPPEYTGSASGTPLPGQQGWTGTSGPEYQVLSYAGNAPGFVQNPAGGEQFIAGHGGVNSSGASLPVVFTDGAWTISYDMSPVHTTGGGATFNKGRFSLGSTTGAAVRRFSAQTDFNLPDAWDAEFVVADASGRFTGGHSPGAFWEDLAYGAWYRQSITVDFEQNRIISITLTNLHTGASDTAQPADWYLLGGAGSTFALPDAISFSTGANSVDDWMGYDNLRVVPAPAAAALLATLVLPRRRR